jgi:hypothetical protein
MEAFLQAVCGAEGRSLLDRAVPGASAEATANAEAFFSAELPAVLGWQFGTFDAASVRAPALNVSGTGSEPRFSESAAIIQHLFPDAAQVSIPATHLMMGEAPLETARLLEEFWRTVSTSRRP